MRVAGHDPASRVFPEAAYESALLALMDSLACAFKAVQEPTCAQLLGAVVPGATMAFGARVPGTSFQLDPVQAAFNIGTMVAWHDVNDPALATASGHLADNFGAILAVADYRARKALAEGATPPTVRDVSAAVIAAHENASLEWARMARVNATPTQAAEARASVSARCTLIRIASAAAVASLLDGTDEQVAAAVAIARSETPHIEHPSTPLGSGPHERWRLGDATSRGVRLALLALTGEATTSPTALPEGDLAARRSVVTIGLEQTWRLAPSAPEVETRVRDRFAACVTTLFPAGQAGRIAAIFTDRIRLEAMPINELVSMMVRN
jgi:2-methylcitrate dehydratase